MSSKVHQFIELPDSWIGISLRSTCTNELLNLPRFNHHVPRSKLTVDSLRVLC
jgi:hypothetical protein